jgi:glucokinase
MTAQAWLLEDVSPREVMQVGGGFAVPGAPVAWIAPGAGLEVRTFAPWPGEGGLEIDSAGAGAAPLYAHELDESGVLHVLCRLVLGRVCAQDVLSAPGLVRLYEAVCHLRGIPALHMAAADILALARSAGNPECSRATSMFCALLGDFAAGVALHLGAGGGIHLGGPLVPLLGPWFARSSFRQRFEGHGRARERLRGVPTFVRLDVSAPIAAGRRVSGSSSAELR